MSRTRWLAVMATVLAASYVLRIGFFTYALYVVLCLLVVTRLSTHGALAGLEHVRICNQRRAKLGEVVPVSVELHHTGRRPIVWVLAEDLSPAALPRTGDTAKVAMLRHGARMLLSYTLSCTRRGYHQIGPLLLETGDVFGLSRRFVAGESAHYLLVHPEIVPLGQYLEPTHRPVGEVRRERRIFEDPSRLHGVRQYRPGDKLSQVHWRASARSGDLQTKVFEPTTMLGALVCLDLYALAYEQRGVDERSELGVSAAASLACYVANANQRVGFLCNGRDAADRARCEPIEVDATTRAQAEQQARSQTDSHRLRPVEVAVGRGPLTLQRILDATARVELSDFQPLGSLLLREFPRLARDVSLALITPRIDRTLLEAAATMRRSGFLLHVFVLGNDANLLQRRGQLLAHGVHSYGLTDKADLSSLALVRL